MPLIGVGLGIGPKLNNGQGIGFTPPNLSTLQAWYRSDMGITAAMSAVNASGTTPPAVTLTGVPSPLQSVEIDISTNGTLGVATFQWKLGGVVQATGLVTAANVSLNNGTLAAQFSSGTYANNDVYAATVLVTGWADQSGNGVNLTQATTAQQPGYTYSDANWNGRPSLLFSGGQDLKAGATSPNLAQPVTVYASCLLSSSAATQFVFDGQTVRSALFWSTTPAWNIFSGTAQAAATGARTASAFACVFNGASSFLYQNASGSPLLSGVAAGVNNLDGLIVGCQFNASSFMTGSVVELAAYTGAHTASQVSQYLKYQASLYGQAWS